MTDQITILKNETAAAPKVKEIGRGPKVFLCNPRDWISNIMHRGKVTNSYGAESVQIFVDERDGSERDIFLQTPILKTRYGWSEFPEKPKPGDPEDKVYGMTYSLGVEIDPNSANKAVQDFLGAIKDMEVRTQQMAKASAATWFPKEDVETIPMLKKSVIEKDKDASKLPQIKFDFRESYKYDPTVPTSQFDMRVYPHSEIAKQKKNPEYEPVPVHPRSITKGSDLILMTKFEKISLYGGRYKLKPIVDHCVLYPAPTSMKGCMIDTERDDRAFLEEQDTTGKRSRSPVTSDPESESKKLKEN